RAVASMPSGKIEHRGKIAIANKRPYQLFPELGHVRLRPGKIRVVRQPGLARVFGHLAQIRKIEHSSLITHQSIPSVGFAARAREGYPPIEGPHLSISANSYEE